MSKNGTTTVHTTLVGGKVPTLMAKAVLVSSQGTMFGEGGLEKVVYMKNEKKYGIMKSQKIGMTLYFYFC